MLRCNIIEATFFFSINNIQTTMETRRDIGCCGKGKHAKRGGKHEMKRKRKREGEGR